MDPETCNVLFLCTGNSARSLLAESILNHEGGGRFRAFSAGSHPSPAGPHPLAVELLDDLGHDTSALRSKSWDEFGRKDALRINLVVTVCDNAAAEVCPIWPGQPLRAHWGLPDPAAVTGTEAERHRAFADTYLALLRRISALLALPFDALDRVALQQQLDVIGRAGKSDPAA